MKYKIIFILLALNICFGFVEAKGFGKITTLVNKCEVVSNNKVSIPVKVVGINNNLLSKEIDKYSLGMLDNDENNIIINITDIKGNNIKNILIDDNRDSYKRSYIYFYITDDISLNATEEILNFNLNIEFIENVPDSIYVLGNEVVLMEDKEVCNSLNNNKIIENELSEVDLDQKSDSNKNVYVLYGIILFLILLLIIQFVKIKKDS